MSPLVGFSDILAELLSIVLDVMLLSKDFVTSMGISIKVSPVISIFMSLGLGAGSPETNDWHK